MSENLILGNGAHKEEQGNDTDDISKKYPRFGKRGAPQAFATKLLELLSSEPPEIVSWNKSGVAFQIKDTDRFTSEVLMKYFKHNNPSSFQRQLNLYGFRKVLRGPDSGSYLHPNFKRENPDAIKGVRRTVQASHNSKRILKPDQVSAELGSEYMMRGNAEGNIGLAHDLKRRRKDDGDMYTINPNPNGLSAQRNAKISQMPMDYPHHMAYPQIPISSHHLGYPFMNMHQGAGGINHAGLGMMNGMHLPTIAPILLPAGGHPAMGGLPMQFYYPHPNVPNSQEGKISQPQIPATASQSMIIPQYAHCYFGQNLGNRQPSAGFSGSIYNVSNAPTKSQEISDGSMGKTESNTSNKDQLTKDVAANVQMKYHVPFSAISQMPVLGYNQSHGMKGASEFFNYGGSESAHNIKNTALPMSQEEKMQQIHMRFQAIQRIEALRLMQQQQQQISSSFNSFYLQPSEALNNKEVLSSEKKTEQQNEEPVPKTEDQRSLGATHGTEDVRENSTMLSEKPRSLQLSSLFNPHLSSMKNEGMARQVHLPNKSAMNVGQQDRLIPQHFIGQHSIQKGFGYNPNQWNFAPVLNPTNPIPSFPIGQQSIANMAVSNNEAVSLSTNQSNGIGPQKEKQGISKSESGRGLVAGITASYIEREHGSSDGLMQSRNPSEIAAAANSEI